MLEDDPLLEPGQEVLFVTRFDEKQGWHTITTPRYGDLRIGGPAERRILVDRFAKAKQEQVNPAPTS